MLADSVPDAANSRSSKVWHQSWVDNQGTLLLQGGLRDGSVRQHGESTDAEGKWTTAFDGLYARK